MKKLLRKGFTIVELVIVIAVIAILAGVLIPTFSGVVEKANQSAALQKATSAMKSTLAMSDYGKISDGTQFIIVSNDKVAYRFDYKNNAIGNSSESKLPTDWNAIIVKGTSLGESVSIGASDRKLIKSIIPSDNLLKDVTDDAKTKFVGNGSYYVAYVVTSDTESVSGKTYYHVDGEGKWVSTTWAAGVFELVDCKFYINTDYPSDIITVTTSK